MTVPDNAIELPGGNRVEVAGESAYLAVFERTFGARTEDGIRSWYEREAWRFDR